MQHKPSRLLSDAQRTMQFIATDSVFAVHHEPHSRKPLLKGNRRVLEHSADFERELLLWMIAIAAIQPSLFEIGNFVGIAIGAADFPVKPAHGNHELTAVFKVQEELDGLLKCFWAFHARNVAGKR